MKYGKAFYDTATFLQPTTFLVQILFLLRQHPCWPLQIWWTGVVAQTSVLNKDFLLPTRKLSINLSKLPSPRIINWKKVSARDILTLFVCIRDSFDCTIFEISGNLAVNHFCWKRCYLTVASWIFLFNQILVSWRSTCMTKVTLKKTISSMYADKFHI